MYRPRVERDVLEHDRPVDLVPRAGLKRLRQKPLATLLGLDTLTVDLDSPARVDEQAEVKGGEQSAARRRAEDRPNELALATGLADELRIGMRLLMWPAEVAGENEEAVADGADEDQAEKRAEADTEAGLFDGNMRPHESARLPASHLARTAPDQW